MILTKRDLLQLTPTQIKVSGHYGFKEEPRTTYCKCKPNYRIGDPPNKCLSCGKSIKF